MAMQPGRRRSRLMPLAFLNGSHVSDTEGVVHTPAARGHIRGPKRVTRLFEETVIKENAVRGR